MVLGSVSRMSRPTQHPLCAIPNDAQHLCCNAVTAARLSTALLSTALWKRGMHVCTFDTPSSHCTCPLPPSPPPSLVGKELTDSCLWFEIIRPFLLHPFQGVANRLLMHIVCVFCLAGWFLGRSHPLNNILSVLSLMMHTISAALQSRLPSCQLPCGREVCMCAHTVQRVHNIPIAHTTVLCPIPPSHSNCTYHSFMPHLSLPSLPPLPSLPSSLIGW